MQSLLAYLGQLAKAQASPKEPRDTIGNLHIATRLNLVTLTVSLVAMKPVGKMIIVFLFFLSFWVGCWQKFQPERINSHTL